MNKLLEIKNLSIQFRHGQTIVKAVEEVHLDVYENEILALVGESGSGKTITALSITGLLPPSAEILSGKIIFQKKDLLKAGQSAIEAIRGKEISYIFQEAAASLNPVLTIGRQIAESIMLHQNKSKKEASLKALELLRLVHLPHPENILRSYPHQLSGGMNQRVMIAISVAAAHCADDRSPRILIADEPTASLDVTIGLEIMRMLLELKAKMKFSILFITHNLALVQEFAQRVAIMFKGRIVEQADSKKIFSSPCHPHTQDLIQSIIRL
jgi:ABC-type dipeptide/oligopeptide/nickel transport system ATPase component